MTDENEVEDLVASNDSIRAITWDLVRDETAKDTVMQSLASLINTVFPLEKHEMPRELLPYWSIRHDLYIIDGVILMGGQVVIPQILRSQVTRTNTAASNVRVVIPLALRKEVIISLHSAPPQTTHDQ